MTSWWTPEQEKAPGVESQSWAPSSKGSLYQPSDSDGDRADVARRARVRNQLPPAQRAHHLPRDALDDQIANLIIAQFLHLESEDPEKEIYIYVISPGVRSTPGLGSTHDAVHEARRRDLRRGHRDAMGTCSCLRRRKASGCCRRTRRSTSTRCSERRPGTGGRHRDRGARNYQHARDEWKIFLPTTPSQPLEKVSKDMERDYSMTVQEAKDYGIIHTVVMHGNMRKGEW